MGVRIWTIEELNHIHPLNGWAWAYDEQVGWYARALHGNATVCIDLQGEVLALWGGTEKISPHRDVTLALILVSKGCDSFEAMAVEVERRVSNATLGGLLGVWRGVVAMLRRGTVVRSAESSAPGPVE